MKHAAALIFPIPVLLFCDAMQSQTAAPTLIGKYVCAGTTLRASRNQPDQPLLTTLQARQHDRQIATPLKIVGDYFNADGINYDIQVEGDKTVYGFTIFQTCSNSCVSPSRCQQGGGIWQTLSPDPSLQSRVKMSNPTRWQSALSTISTMPDDSAAETIMNAVWNEIIVTCAVPASPDTTSFWEETTDFRSGSHILTEFRGLRVSSRIDPEALSEATKLNGIQWRGRAIAQASAYRSRDYLGPRGGDRGWSQWAEGGQILLEVKKEKNRWKVSYGANELLAFHDPDQSTKIGGCDVLTSAQPFANSGLPQSPLGGLNRLPPAPSTTPNPNPSPTSVKSPLPTSAQLTIHNGFKTRPGQNNPLARTPFNLMRNDFSTTLAQAGIKVAEGISPPAAFAKLCRQDAACNTRIIRSSVAGAAATAISDANGNAVLPPVPPGEYYLCIYGYDLNHRNLFWNIKLDLIPGENSFTLTPESGIPLK